MSTELQGFDGMRTSRRAGRGSGEPPTTMSKKHSGKGLIALEREVVVEGRTQTQCHVEILMPGVRYRVQTG